MKQASHKGPYIVQCLFCEKPRIGKPRMPENRLVVASGEGAGKGCKVTVDGDRVFSGVIKIS